MDTLNIMEKIASKSCESHAQRQKGLNLRVWYIESGGSVSKYKLLRIGMDVLCYQDFHVSFFPPLFWSLVTWLSAFPSVAPRNRFLAG